MKESEKYHEIGDRLTKAPAPELVESAFAFEAREGALLYSGMSLADLAQAIMLIEGGLVSPEVGAELLRGLLEMNAIPVEEVTFKPELDDVYTNRKRELYQRVPEKVAGWLQAARPRREASTIAYLLVTRRNLLELVGALCELMEALLDVASDHRNTLMPDYTYLQIATPTTVAHYLLTFAQPMVRDLDRLRLTFEHVNRSPAGAGCTNGSRLPLDRQRLSDLLGFEEVALHTRDAMWQSDVQVEIISALVALMTNIDRLAEDLQIWVTAEFGFAELSDSHSRISVIMPQKKNPYSLAFVRGVAREMLGRQTSTAALQATPSGQVDNRIFTYSTVPYALTQTTDALELMAGTISGLTVHEDVTSKRARDGFSGATDLADVIMIECNVDARTAHRIVGRTVRMALEAGAEDLNSELLDKAAEAILGHPLTLADDRIADAMDPEQIIETRSCLGGASPQAVEEMIAVFREKIDASRAWQSDEQARIESAEQALVEHAEGLCQRT